MSAGRPARELDDAELESQGTQAHATRNWVFLHGTAEQFERHTLRMLELEQEYLRRHPQRTWQGSGTVAAADPERALLAAVEGAGGRMHKLEAQQAARAVGLPRAALARLYSRGLLSTETSDRVLTDAGREWLARPPASSTVLEWTPEDPATWDTDKARIIGGAPAGVFTLVHSTGDVLPGDWWSARDAAGTVHGFGWLDVTWGEAEILLAVDGRSRRTGVGGWILDRLEGEAAARGLNYVYNTVAATHPDRDRTQEWLDARGYRSAPGEAAMRKRVGVVPERPVLPVGADPSDRGPGQEEQGGYVDAEHHQY